MSENIASLLPSLLIAKLANIFTWVWDLVAFNTVWSATLILVMTIFVLIGTIKRQRNPYVFAGVSAVGLLIALLVVLSLAVSEGLSLGHADKNQAILNNALETGNVLAGYLYHAQALVLFCAISIIAMTYHRLSDNEANNQRLGTYHKLAQHNYNNNHGYHDNHKNYAEAYILILLSTIGALSVIIASNVAVLLIALALLFVPLYGLLVLMPASNNSSGQSVLSIARGGNFFVLSMFAFILMIMGMGLMFAQAGSLDFQQLASIRQQAMHQQAINQQTIHPQTMMTHASFSALGALLLCIAMMFKLGVIPFHSWMRDNFRSLDASVLVFVDTLVKVSVTMALMSVALLIVPVENITQAQPVALIMLSIAGASVLLGNFWLSQQRELKGVLFYSSIAQMGFILFLLLSSAPVSTVLIYLSIYSMAMVGAYAVMILLEDEKSLQGLFWRRPLPSLVLAVMLLSLAGMPFTAGFITKIQMVYATTLANGLLGVVSGGVVLIGSMLGMIGYLKIVAPMFSQPSPVKTPKIASQRKQAKTVSSTIIQLIVIIISAVLVVLGVVPKALLVGF